MTRTVLAAAALAVALGTAGSASGRPDTTNAPAIFTSKVTIRDAGMSVTPNHAVRGSTVTFILTNRGRKAHTFVIGSAGGAGKGHLGFKQLLKPSQQFTKVMFLDYRGIMPFALRTGTRTVAHGSFIIK